MRVEFVGTEDVDAFCSCWDECVCSRPTPAIRVTTEETTASGRSFEVDVPLREVKLEGLLTELVAAAGGALVS